VLQVARWLHMSPVDVEAMPWHWTARTLAAIGAESEARPVIERYQQAAGRG